MHIVVCVKQTPKSDNVKIDPSTGCLIRSGAGSALNPFDEFALEEAVKFKEIVGGKVSVLTMGPPSAEKVLRDCISRGADTAYHLNDTAFAGSDTWATSYSLSLGIQKINEKEKVDMVLCGKQTNDSDTGHIGSQISAWLSCPCISFVKKAGLVENKLLVERLMEDGTDILEIPLPCVMSVLKEINDPRVPSVSGRMAAKKAAVTTWTADDIGADKNKLGVKHSPTRVIKSFVPKRENKSALIEGSPKEKASQITAILKGGNL